MRYFREESAITSLRVRLKTFGIAFENFDDAIVGLEQWKDVISSIDFFLSPKLGISNPEEMNEGKGLFFHLPLHTCFTFEGPLVPTQFLPTLLKIIYETCLNSIFIRSIPTERVNSKLFYMAIPIRARISNKQR